MRIGIFAVVVDVVSVNKKRRKIINISYFDYIYLINLSNQIIMSTGLKFLTMLPIFKPVLI